MTSVFVLEEDWNNQYNTPQEYAELEGKIEGEEFDLVQVAVTAKTRYRIVNGKPFAIALSFAGELLEALKS